MTIVLPKQKQRILEYLKDYIKRHGYAPTLSEIARKFQVTSLATVHEHLEKLERLGFIKRDNKPRELRIVADEAAPSEDAVSLPIVGTITAGQPIEAIEHIEEGMPVPKQLIGNKRAYILRVKGDSMIESLIADGDYVILEKTEYAKDGDMVVALLEDGTATLKKFFKTRNLIRLQPANKKYKPLYTKNVIIQGRVIGIIRKF